MNKDLNKNHSFLKTDSKFMNEFLIEKFQNYGFDSFNTEELAYTMITPSFPIEFNKKTGEIWSNIYQVKSVNKLRSQNIDLHFLHQKIPDQQYQKFYLACQSGNLEQIRDFYKNYKSEELNHLYDVSGKSPLHYAIKNNQFAVVEFLLERGYSVDNRDKLFRTPLHLCCIYGHAKIADYLIKQDLNILDSKDLRGRNSAHFACCSATTDCLNILLMYKKEIIYQLDTYQRSTLHYAVLNSSPEKLEFLRILLDQKVDINLQDYQGRTVMHYISSLGEKRAIPYLIQRGADLTIKDKNNKTALELALDDRTREVMIIYCQKPNQISLQDKKFLSKGVSGRKVQITKENYVKGVTNSGKKSKVSKLIISQGGETPVSNFIQNNFYDLMKKLQKNGVETFQHVRKPYLFTGSWFEGVQSIEDLHDRIKMIAPTDALIRCFNIICPYEHGLPQQTDDQACVNSFYGFTNTFDNILQVQQNIQQVLRESQKFNDQNQNVFFENIVKKKELEILNLKEEILKLHSDLKYQQSQENQKFQQDMVQKLKKDLEDIQKDRDTQMQSLMDERQENRVLKKQYINCEQILQKKVLQVKNLKRTIEVQNQTIQGLNEDIQKYQKGLIDQKKSQTVILKKHQKKKNFLQKKIQLEQEIAFQRIIHSLKKQNLKFEDEICKFDKDTDGKMTRYEFTEFLQNHIKNPIRMYNLIDFFELNKNMNELCIQDFLEVIKQRTIIRQQEEQKLIIKLIRELKRQNIDPEKFDENFDIQNYDDDNSGQLNLGEFKGFLADLELTKVLNDDEIRKLFDFLDEDDSGQISLQEFKTKIETVNFLQKVNKGDIQKEQLKNKSQVIEPIKKLQLKQENENQYEYDPSKPIKGEIKIQCLNLRPNPNFDQSIDSIKLRLPGASKNWIGKKLQGQNLDNFKYACRIPIENQIPTNISDDIIIVLNSENKSITKTNLKWKTSLNYPNEWVINEERVFDNGFSITIQVKFIKGIDTVKDQEIKKQNFIANTHYKGSLNINVIEISDILEPILEKYKDIQLKCNFYRSKKKLNGIVEDNKLFFNQEISEKIDVLKGSFVNYLKFQLVLKKGILQKNQILGECCINFQEALNFAGEEMQNRFFFLEINGKKTQMKIQLGIKYNQLNDKVDETIKGSLKIKIHRARNLKGVEKTFFTRQQNIDPYFKILLPINKEKTLKYQTQYKSSQFEPSYEEDALFDLELLKSIDLYTKKQILPKLQIQLWDRDNLKDDYIGETQVDWQQCYENPGQWMVNDFYEIKNDKNEIYGEVYISLNFIPENFLDRNLCCQDIEQKNSITEQNNFIEGKFILKILFMIDLKYISMENYVLQKNTELNPIVKIEMPNKEKFQTKKTCLSDKHSDNKVYMVNESFETQCKFKNIYEIQDLNLEVYQKCGLLQQEKFLSKLSLGIQECINYPGDWIINNAFYLLHDPEALLKTKVQDVGRIYLQARFVPDKMVISQLKPQLSSYFSDILQEEKIFNGKIRFRLIHCKDLPKMDLMNGKSDPYVTFELIGPKKFKCKSKTLKDTSNPIFEELIDLDVNIQDSKINDYKLQIKIYDDDVGVDDFIGSVILQDVSQLLYNKDSWEINQIFNIESKIKNDLKPQIYFQAVYLEESNNIPEFPPLLEDLDKQLKKYQKKGFLYVDFKHCKGLPQIEDNQTQIDPYVKLIFTKGKEKIVYTTKKVENCNHPQFNDKQYKELSIEDYRQFTKFRIELWDNNKLLCKDQQIGFYQEQNFCQQLFVDKVNEWAIDKIFQFQQFQKFNTKYEFSNFGFAYIKIGFLDNINGTNIKDNVDIENYEQIYQLSNMKGTLCVYLSHAKGLIGKDENNILMKKSKLDNKVSDPYVKIRYKNLNHQSNVIKKTVNPIWQQKFELRGTIIDYYNPGYLEFDVYDKDNFLNSDDYLGSLKIDLQNILINRNTWNINQYYDLSSKTQDQNQKYKNFGQIYLQIGYFEENQQITQSPDVLENLENIKNANFIQMYARIKLDHIINIPIKNQKECTDQYYVKIIFPNKSDKMSKKFKNTYHPKIDQTIIQEMKLNPQSLQPFQIQLYQDYNFQDELICQTMIQAEQFTQNMNTWQINQYFIMKDVEDNEIQIYLQIGIFEYKDEVPQPNILNSKFQDIIIKGQLVLKIVKFLDLKKSDKNGSDAYCKIQYENQNYKTQTFKQIISCDVNEIIVFQVQKDYCELLGDIQFSVYDKDAIKDDFIGKTILDTKKMVQNKNNWQINGIYDLQQNNQTNGKILIQAIYYDEDNKVEDTNNINFPQTNILINEYKKTIIQGEIFVAVIRCQNLVYADSNKKSDPYVKLKFMNQKNKTKIVKKCLNPVYEEIKKFKINLKDKNQLEKLYLKIYDDDILVDDLIGSVEIDIADIFDQPNTWIINKSYQIEGPQKLQNKFNSFGEIYLKIMYRDDEQQQTEIGEILKQNQINYQNKFQLYNFIKTLIFLKQIEIIKKNILLKFIYFSIVFFLELLLNSNFFIIFLQFFLLILLCIVYLFLLTVFLLFTQLNLLFCLYRFIFFLLK